ncbi:MAG: hypothetical protein COB66_09470 [Coxiella sp. (in: Bacteria)]|nr:MAG: hypothetical protein COB66_09470 [Coxiella sp. (in: g-proteobacteria)]
MRYLQKTLLNNERIIFVAHPHWIVYVPSVCTLVIAVLLFAFGPYIAVINLSIASFTFYEILSIACGLVGAFTFIKAYIFHRTSEYGITNKRILMKMGWIERNSLELFLDKIEAVHINQSITGRLLGFGTLVVIGTGGSRDPFINVPKPLEFRKIVQQAIDDHEEHVQTR